MTYVIGIDQSTQGTKAILFDSAGKIVKKISRAHEQIISDQGWVSHNSTEIYHNVIALVDELTQDIDKSQIVTVGITNQRETSVAWYKDSGHPVDHAIVWQCARAKSISDRIDPKTAQMIKEKTGLTVSPFYPSVKYAWLLNEHPELDKDNICLGTIDSWLVFKLTDGQSFVTDITNASRTQLFNLEKLVWDDDVCDVFGVKRNMLPNVLDSDALFGMTTFNGILPSPIPIRAVMGDSHAALYSHGGYHVGDTKITYGTGSSIMMNIGAALPEIPHNLSVSIGWKAENRLHYVLEGNINYTGAIISWLINDLKLIDTPEEVEQLIAAANDNDDCYIIPAFSGLSAPFWNDNLTASINGMTRLTGKAEIVKAAIDSIAFQVKAVLREMERHSDIQLSTIFADGGPTANRYLMQIQSDLANACVQLSQIQEASCHGVALMASRTVGQEFSKAKKQEAYCEYQPRENRHLQEKYKKWLQAILLREEQ
ncbi:glycerol kinase [Streptococcus merionis]|uniref:FGGY-family carbohydrate kinase n=1 Tax=Streptococcus merionis TaxID=400065 RepID=UPI0026EFF413|nr:FGGY family carbohydrate kinase [Streptococcus merionis]